ncbi:hypothetical protein LG634_26815 [Streptomyces bambusae]|uniref:hypothetical protein n=1 Tax=Streptomyces bambusae TaxID=1550616 RepID=UPI001CFD5392|nr:hypothetical protein [Streptomyces bambusae]MCB5168423.1 hypothetical protein [Streptomyces bambusae]
MGGTGPADGGWEPSDEEGGALSGRWWRWADSAPADRCPVRDKTGEHAGWNQPADVWFLAGTYGGHVVRRCTVPSDRPVFFPVLNLQHNRFHARTPQRMAVVEAMAALNGVPLPLREFAASFRTKWLTRRFTWGVWTGLAPLVPGEYVLEIKALADDGFWVDTTYHLAAATV